MPGGHVQHLPAGGGGAVQAQPGYRVAQRHHRLGRAGSREADRAAERGGAVPASGHDAPRLVHRAPGPHGPAGRGQRVAGAAAPRGKQQPDRRGLRAHRDHRAELSVDGLGMRRVTARDHLAVLVDLVPPGNLDVRDGEIARAGVAGLVLAERREVEPQLVTGPRGRHQQERVGVPRADQVDVRRHMQRERAPVLGDALAGGEGPAVVELAAAVGEQGGLLEVLVGPDGGAAGREVLADPAGRAEDDTEPRVAGELVGELGAHRHELLHLRRHRLVVAGAHVGERGGVHDVPLLRRDGPVVEVGQAVLIRRAWRARRRVELGGGDRLERAHRGLAAGRGQPHRLRRRVFEANAQWRPGAAGPDQRDVRVVVRSGLGSHYLDLTGRPLAHPHGRVAAHGELGQHHEPLPAAAAPAAGRDEQADGPVVAGGHAELGHAVVEEVVCLDGVVEPAAVVGVEDKHHVAGVGPAGQVGPGDGERAHGEMPFPGPLRRGGPARRPPRRHARKGDRHAVPEQPVLAVAGAGVVGCELASERRPERSRRRRRQAAAGGAVGGRGDRYSGQGGHAPRVANLHWQPASGLVMQQAGDVEQTGAQAAAQVRHCVGGNDVGRAAQRHGHELRVDPACGARYQLVGDRPARAGARQQPVAVDQRHRAWLARPGNGGARRNTRGG